VNFHAVYVTDDFLNNISTCDNVLGQDYVDIIEKIYLYSQISLVLSDTNKVYTPFAVKAKLG
jgi:hypothetical protein